ncbi:MAG: hypothetical protein ACXWCC_17075 [Caldimonas sp.]
MPNAQDILWFKSNFQPLIEPAIAGTPFSVDMLAAFACQETGEIWPLLRRKGLPVARVLELCVGDTIDASPTGGGRRAFPKNKAELLVAPDGDRMFAIARQALLDMAEQIPAYRGAAARPDKFCHGYGIFQLDLQFFRTEPDYFLEKRYADFGAALDKCLGELKAAMRRIGWQDKTALSDLEMAGVAIAYNTGRFDPARGLKQGYFDGQKYYGENFFAFLQLAKNTPLAEAPPPGATRGPRAMPRPAAKKKTAAKKAAPAKKAATKKGVAKKAAAKKAVPAKKAAVKRVRAKKAPAKKEPAKKAAAKKTR